MPRTKSQIQHLTASKSYKKNMKNDSAKKDKTVISAAIKKPKKKKSKNQKPSKQLVRARKHITQAQKETKRLMKKAPLHAFIREIAKEYKTDVRFTGEALDALHEASEAFMVDLFSKSTVNTYKNGRDTLLHKDMLAVGASNPLFARLPEVKQREALGFYYPSNDEKTMQNSAKPEIKADKDADKLVEDQNESDANEDASDNESAD